jgi:hypothetical protein
MSEMSHGLERISYASQRPRLPIPYALINSISIVSTNLYIPAMEDPIETRERKIMEYEQKEYLAQHLILSSTLLHLSQKLLQHITVKAMWDDIKLNATTKSSLHQVNILNRLQPIKCPSSLGSKIHLSEVKSHFEKMTQ